MSWLLIVGLKNALIAVPLAMAALAAGRCFRRPALAHVLWVLVLVKLLTPPLVDVPVGWSIDVSPWLAEQPGSASMARLTQPTAPAPSVAPVVLVENQIAVSPVGSDLRNRSGPTTNRTVKSAPHAAPAAAPDRVRDWLLVPAWLRLPETSGDWLVIVGGLWLMGSATSAALMLRRSLRFHRFLRLAARSDYRLAGRVRQLAQAVGLTSSPAVIVVEGVVSPMLWGLGRRVQLVFPARLAERLAPSEIDALLLHELAHYARGDYWVRLIELVAHVAYWWHPVVWWTRHEIEAAEEQCCDAWVVEHQSGTRQSYAEALLATIDFLSEPATALPPAACGLGDVPLLRSRLVQIMRGELGGQVPRSVWIGVLGLGVILSPLEPALFATSTRERPPAVAPLPTPRLINKTVPGDPAEQDTLPAAPPAAPLPASPLPGPAPSAPAVDERPVSIIFASAQSPDGRYTLEARTNYETTLIGPKLRLGLSSNRITASAFAPDSRTFITGHEDGLLRQWDSQTGGRMITLRASSAPIVSVACSPTGTQVAAGASDGTLSVWDVTTETEVARLANPEIAVSCLRWSADGSRLAVALGNWTARDDARVIVWSPANGQLVSGFAASAPIGALDWLSSDVVLLAEWSGAARAVSLADGLPLRVLALDKDLVSAAHWSPACRLITAWEAEQLVLGNVR